MKRLLVVLCAIGLMLNHATAAHAVTVFHDDFNDSSLDLTKWEPTWLTGSDTTINHPPSPGYQDACTDPANVSQPGDGYLHLTLTHTTCTVSGHDPYDYHGALVNGLTDNNLFTDEYTVTVRAWLPGTSTTLTGWPGLWDDCDGTCWPGGGEVDGMEGLDGSACFHVHSTPHPEGVGGCEAMGTGWHDFQWKRTDTLCKFYYDSVQVGSKSCASFTGIAHGLVLQMLQSYGAPSTGTVTMLVDDVSVVAV